MVERVVITGLGVVSSVGTSRAAFFDALGSGRSGIRPVVAAPGEAAASGLSAPILDFDPKAHFEPRVLRRLARLSQLSLVAAREALAQAKGAATAMPWAPERTGVVLGTGLGTLRETIEFMRGYLTAGPEMASPLLFPSSVMNAAAGQIAIELGLRGLNTTLNHRDASSMDALMLAADCLALGRADALLVGGVDELCEPLLHGYRQLAQLATTALRPYAKERQGTVIGEGAAVLVMEREADAIQRGARVLARLAGYAAGGEDRARIGWRGSWRGGGEVIRAALEQAGVAPEAIDYVAGAGSGLAVDAIEARAVVAALGERSAPHGSILGQTGDFMAAGALRIASALYAFERQALPGTVGAGEPDPEAPVPQLVQGPRAATVSTVLLPTLAQGGSDSAIVLERAA